MAVAFARVLRGAGVDVPLGATLTFTEALGCVGLGDRSAVDWAARATLVNRPEDLAVFDRAFAVFWNRVEGSGDDVEELPPEEVVIALDLPDGGDHSTADDDEAVDAPVVTLRWSA